MPSDRSQSSRTDFRRLLIRGHERAQNPKKRLQDKGVVPASVVTELKRLQVCCILNIDIIYVEIQITDIATLDPATGYYVLNANTTIASNQILVIPFGVTLSVAGTILTNYGIITLEGTLRVSALGVLNNNSSINRSIYMENVRANAYGIINISAGGLLIAIDGGYVNNAGDINNSGQITMEATAIFTNTGILNNNIGSELAINNTNNTPTYVNNAGGIIYNNGTVYNTNQGQIYNNSGGVFDNSNGVYEYLNPPYNGQFYNADGTGTCGIGTIIDSSIPIPIDGTECPTLDINLYTIATEVVSGFFVLNANTTIASNERLTIPAGIELKVSGTTLINEGVILVEGSIRASADLQNTGPGTITNNNSITISIGGDITATGDGYLNNEGFIGNNGIIQIQSVAILTNNSYIQNNPDGSITIFSDTAYINNTGTIENSGLINNYYLGQIYNNSNGNFNNLPAGVYEYGTAPNTGKFYNADGTGTCGSGTVVDNDDPIPIDGNDCPPSNQILLADIATLDPPSTWILNTNTTIASNKILTVPTGFTLIAIGTTLINEGTIIAEGSLKSSTEGIITNNGVIQITGEIVIIDNGYLNNSATINNNGLLVVQNIAILTNTGTINNNATSVLQIFNGSAPTYIDNTGLITNNGTIQNDFLGQIYNNSGGTVDNTNGTYTYSNGTNSGQFFNADGTSTCGVGTIIDNSNPIPIQGVNCPPFIIDIAIEDIATLDSVSGFYVLNTNTTIAPNERLTILAAVTLDAEATILINNGTINVQGNLRAKSDGSRPFGIITNNGTIDISFNGNITATSYGFLNNSNTINNSGTIVLENIAILDNYGLINNNLGSGLTITNGIDPTYIINTGQIVNNGSIVNVLLGQIYNNSGGTFDNSNGLYYGGVGPQGGTFFNADGTGGCGTGNIINSGTPIPIAGNNCGPTITNIVIADIATLGAFGFYYLNTDTVIAYNSLLTIPAGTTLLAYGKTLTNNGIIVVEGDLQSSSNGSSPFGIINNNNTINISTGGNVLAFDTGYLNNYGTIDNDGTVTIQNIAILTNTGIINNNGGSNLVILYIDAYVNNVGGKIYNNGTIENRVRGQIYNNSGGTVDNTNGTYNYTGSNPTYDGKFFNANGTSTCGIGIIIDGIVAIPITGTSCPSSDIILENIATQTSTDLFVLNENTTIASNQTLTIPVNITLVVEGKTLTNNGTINVVGFLSAKKDTKSGVSGTITNDGTINISLAAILTASDDGYVNNSDIINNNGAIAIQNIAIFTNTGTINNNAGSTIQIDNANEPTYINNIGGTIINNGAITNNNLGQIYNNSGGIVNNTNGTYNYGGGSTAGKFFNADGTGACGVGTIINNSTPIPIEGTACQPGTDEILIADIATEDPVSGYYVLNMDTTIEYNQILTVPSGIILIALGNTLTNNGTITVEGTLRCSSVELATPPPGQIVNTGNINILSGGNLMAISFGLLNNLDYINNLGIITIQQAAAELFNTGTVINESGSTLILDNSGDDNTRIKNSGTITNTGTIYNQTGGIIYNYAGGLVDSVGSYIYTSDPPGNNGIFYNADGSSFCGIGSTIGITQIDGNDCPA